MMSLFGAPQEIHEAVRRGDLTEVKSLLSKNSEWMSSQDKNGRRNGRQNDAAPSCNHKNKRTLAEYLIENGVNVNVRKQFQVTPLHLAAVFGHTDMIALLIENGADPNAWSDFAGAEVEKAKPPCRFFDSPVVFGELS